MHVRIKDSNLIREMSSKAVLATNQSELKAYQDKRQRKLQEEARLHHLEQEVATIKSLLQELVQHVKSNQSR